MSSAGVVELDVHESQRAHNQDDEHDGVGDLEWSAQRVLAVVVNSRGKSIFSEVGELRNRGWRPVPNHRNGVGVRRPSGRLGRLVAGVGPWRTRREDGRWNGRR